VCIEHYFRLSRQGKQVWKHLDAESFKICGYIRLLNRIANESPSSVNRLKGSSFDDESVKGFLFELDIAIHFFRRGHEVKFVDLEGSGNYDSIAKI
jgi:hypothetical protein